jgi:hypothetical protein
VLDRFLNMFAQLTITITLALLSAATPVVVRDSFITLPLARRFNTTGSKTVLQRDQARAQGFKSGTRARTHTAAASAASGTSFPEAVTNGAVSYTAEVCLLFCYLHEQVADRSADRSW